MFSKIRIVFYLAIPVVYFTTLKSQTLTIATAANFREPMEKISALFMKENPDIKVLAVYGSSGNLYQQIVNRAPFDIFFSANMQYVEELYNSALTTSEPKIYAVGQLVLWSKDVAIGNDISIVISAKIKKIAIANPDLAPYGASAVECLKYFRLYDRVKDKLVLAENINQAAQFAVSGNCDAGFLAMSQMRSAAVQNTGSYTVVPIGSYSPIKQGVVVIERKENAVSTSKFMTFMQSEKVKAIILAYGYKSGNL